MTITLSNPGNRKENMDEERSNALIARWKTEIDAAAASADGESAVEVVKLCGRCYPPEGAKIVAGFLKDYVSTIRTVDMSDVIASLVTELGLETLGIFAVLFAQAPVVALDVSDNAIGEQGLVPMRPLLQVATLRKLKLRNNGFAAESMQKLALILDDGVCSRLQELSLYNNMAGVKGAEAVGERILPRMTNLQVFTYEGMRPQPQGCVAISKGLAASSASGKLCELYLEGSYGSEEEARQNLATTIKNSPNLNKVRLYDAELGNEEFGAQGLADVCEALMDKKLVSLELAQNEITIKSVRKSPLVQLIQRNLSTLEKLDLSANEIYSSGGCALMSVFPPDASQEVALQTLNLTETFLGHNAVAALTKATLPNLTSVSLDENGFTESDVEMLRNAFGDKLADMDNNDEDGDFDDDDEGLDQDDDGEDDAAVDSLTDQMANLGA